MEKDHYFHLPEKQPVAFAGLWGNWHGEEEIIETCTIATTTPNAEIQSVGHHRMPVVITEEDEFALWLDSEIVERKPLEKLLHSSPDGMFQGD